MRIGLVLWGFVLVLISGLLALQALSIAAENAWTLIWPLLLIVVGISILYSVLLSWREAQFAAHPQLQTIPLGTATSARIRIEHGSGRLNLAAATTPSDVLLTGTFGGGLRYRSQQVGGLLNVEMEPEVKRVVPVPWGSGDDLDWSFQLNPAVSLILDVELGPAADTLDLTGLQITDLRVKTSTSPCTISFPAATDISLTRATIEVGTGGVTLYIPTAMSARIRTEGGLAGIQIDETRFPRDGAYHKSPDYDAASPEIAPPAHRLDLEIQVGMGSLTIL